MKDKNTKGNSFESKDIKANTIEHASGAQIKEAAEKLTPGGHTYEGSICVHIYKPKISIGDSAPGTFITHNLIKGIEMGIAKAACEALFNSVKYSFGFQEKQKSYAEKKRDKELVLDP